MERADKIFTQPVGREVIREMKTIKFTETLTGSQPQVSFAILGDVVDKRMRHPVLNIVIAKTVGLWKQRDAAQ